MEINTQQEALFDQMADGLSVPGYAIMDDFIDADAVAQMVQWIEGMRTEGEMKKAGIGKEINFQVDASVRGDFIRWIGPEETHPEIADFLRTMNAFLLYLNRTCFLGLRDFESHLTYYPADTFYKRHVDRFQQKSHRVVSFVLYLNQQWKPGDGGELMLYPEGLPEVKVEPLAGRLACFRSELPHEVLLSHQPRYSITSWMLDKEVGLTFL